MVHSGSAAVPIAIRVEPGYWSHHKRAKRVGELQTAASTGTVLVYNVPGEVNGLQGRIYYGEVYLLH